MRGLNLQTSPFQVIGTTKQQTQSVHMENKDVIWGHVALESLPRLKVKWKIVALWGPGDRLLLN